MDKFQEWLSLITMSLTTIFSFVLIGFGVFVSTNKDQSDVAVISGLVLFCVPIFYNNFFKQ
jgi:hypothetical protein